VGEGRLAETTNQLLISFDFFEDKMQTSRTIGLEEAREKERK